MLKFIIWHECPMTYHHFVEMVDWSVKNVTFFMHFIYQDKPFKNKTTIFRGHFNQVLSMVKNENNEVIVTTCIKKSYLWATHGGHAPKHQHVDPTIGRRRCTRT